MEADTSMNERGIWAPRTALLVLARAGERGDTHARVFCNCGFARARVALLGGVRGLPLRPVAVRSQQCRYSLHRHRRGRDDHACLW